MIRQLAAHIVWMDEEAHTFTVVDGKVVDSKLLPYVPQGSIRVAHVLSMDAETILQWQQTLMKTGQPQLFEQMWEPVLGWDAQSLLNRYKDVVITSKDRNTLKTNLQRKSINVHSGELEREFDPHSWGYDFATGNTMYLGRSLELSYQVETQGGDLILGTAKPIAAANEREMNAVLLELDKATVLARISADQAEYLTTVVLNQFSLSQISTFLAASIDAGATACTALLLNYKNEHYPGYSEMDAFVLDW